jgi:hypothetical protein
VLGATSGTVSAPPGGGPGGAGQDGLGALGRFVSHDAMVMLGTGTGTGTDDLAHAHALGFAASATGGLSGRPPRTAPWAAQGRTLVRP